jgi:glycosyltransferase involved in cell wall biosynthesis
MLAAAGYDVTFIVPGDLDRVVDGVRILGVEKRATRSERVRYTTLDVWRAAKKLDADIYHFHDPELIPVGFMLKISGKKVIYDVHENLPNQVMEKSYLGNRYFRALVAKSVVVLEHLIGWVFDAFAVAAPSIERNFPPAKTVLVRNFVNLSLIDSIDPVERDEDSKFVIIYPGSLSRTRGIKNLIEAMPLVSGEAELWLMGPWHSADFKSECEQTDGWDRTRYLGQKKLEQVISLVKAADAGAHLPLPTPNFADGLAVKGFEFASCSIPFVTTDEPGKRKTFGDFALFADARNPQNIADNISMLMLDRDLCRKLGGQGRKAVENKYSWERESTKLLDLYASLCHPDLAKDQQSNA